MPSYSQNRPSRSIRRKLAFVLKNLSCRIHAPKAAIQRKDVLLQQPPHSNPAAKTDVRKANGRLLSHQHQCPSHLNNADAQCVHCATAPDASLNSPFVHGHRLPSSPNLPSEDHANVEPHHHSERSEDAAVAPTSVDMDESGRHGVTAQPPSEVADKGGTHLVPHPTIPSGSNIPVDDSRADPGLTSLPPNGSVTPAASLSDPAVLSQFRKFFLQLGEGSHLPTASPFCYALMCASAQCRLEHCRDGDRPEILSLQEKASNLKRKKHEYGIKCREILLLQKKLFASRGEVTSLQQQLTQAKDDVVRLTSLSVAGRSELLAAIRSDAEAEAILQKELISLRAQAVSLQHKVTHRAVRIQELKTLCDDDQAKLLGIQRKHAQAKANWAASRASLLQRTEIEMEEAVKRASMERQQEIEGAVLEASLQAVANYKYSGDYQDDLQNDASDLLVEFMKLSKGQINSCCQDFPWKRITSFMRLWDRERRHGAS